MTDFFKMHFLVPLAAVFGLMAMAYFGSQAGLQWVFGVAAPYLSVLLLVEGLIYRIVQWARSPVPFRIPTTCAQQRSLPWINRTIQDKLDNPGTCLETVGRMALEVLAFRSLFRNTRTELQKHPDYPEGAKLVHWSYKWLWLGAIAFHYAFLMVILRHLRFFSEPVWGFVHQMESVDGFIQFYMPVVYLTGVVMLAGLTYLLARRLANPLCATSRWRPIIFPCFSSWPSAITGFFLRYVYSTDVIAIKELAMGLVTLHPEVPAGIGPLFFTHLFLVSVLFAYFPFSKLMHAPGVFLSPTRNMANNNR